MAELVISHRAIAPTALAGLGAQCDCFIYDDVNQQFGVDDADYARWERRLKLLKPAIARIFLPVTDFDPTCERVNYQWDSPEMQRQYRNLWVLQEAGARVNVCMGPWTNKQMTQLGSEKWAVDAMEHLVRQRGFTNIRWLTLFNEPDAIYAPDTPLARELQSKGFGGGLPLADYVLKHRAALELLQQRGLRDSVKLVVGDAVWPPKRRLEWLQLMRREFEPSQVSYSFHHYAPDDESYFDHPDSRPFMPPPLHEEVAEYRAALGPEAELICWEFNQAGWSMGNSAAWLGCGPRGEDHFGTFDTAASHTRKVLTMLAHGVDGMSNWCVGDMWYRSGLKQGVMYMGLWRYRWECWVPRPVYFYFAALMQTFRPGVKLHQVSNLPAGVTGLAASSGDDVTLALVTSEPAQLRWDALGHTRVERLRISRDHVPLRPDVISRETSIHEIPLNDWQPMSQDLREVVLSRNELSLFRFKGKLS